jgi:phosphoenolpyruvate synthase/pyruvate phosphate dikinase
MCEIHNNIIRVDAFADVFDGFSMGSNDLTQLTRGTDRDSEIGGYRFAVQFAERGILATEQRHVLARDDRRLK